MTKFTFSDAWTGPDKTKHAIAGAAIGAVVTFVTKSPLYGALATAAVAAVKEVYDSFGYGTPSFQDLVVTAVSGGFASLIVSNFI